MCESLSACRLYFPAYKSSSCRDRFFRPIPEPLLSVSFFGKLLFSISHSITPGEGSDILIFTKDRVDALVPCLKAFSMSVIKMQRCYFIPSTQAGRNIYIYLDVAGEPQSHELDVVMVEFQFFFHRNIGLCIFVEDVTQQLAQFKDCAWAVRD